MKMRFHKRLSRNFRQKLRNRVLSHHGTAILADTWNGLLLVEAGDFHVGRKLLENGSYDREEIQWLLSTLDSPAPTIVVIGTHIGSLLIPLARSARQLIGFEADAKNFSLLQHNLRLNLVNNAVVYNVAVGAAEGKASFARNSLNTGNSSLTTEGAAGSVEVNMVALDGALAPLEADIDLLVMDIEGHELHALNGGGQTLARSKSLYIEFAPEHLRNHGCEPEALLTLLGSHFPHFYRLEAGKMQHFSSAEGSRQLLSQSGQRGFLTNLLFTREPLPTTEQPDSDRRSP